MHKAAHIVSQSQAENSVFNPTEIKGKGSL